MSTILTNPLGRVVEVRDEEVPNLVKMGFVITPKQLSSVIDGYDSVSMVRRGGLGDVLCTLPAARLIKRRHPGIKVELRTSSTYLDLFKGEPYLDSVVAMGDKSRMNGNSLSIEFDNSWGVNNERGASMKNERPKYRAQMWANHLGMYGNSYAPTLHPFKEEIDWAISKPWDNTKRKRIVLVRNTSNKHKTPPVIKMDALAKSLAKFGRVVEVDAKKESGDWPWSLRQVSAIIKTSDIVVCPDTGLTHMAVGHGVPIVMLPCNTDPMSILQESSVRGTIEGECPNWPCWWNETCILGRGEGTRYECAGNWDVGKVTEVARSILSLRQDRLPRVLAVMLTWNNVGMTMDAIDSLRLSHCESLSMDLMVVDNGSTDGTHEALRAEGIYFENHPGLGVAEAANVGFARAINMGYDYVLLLNNDVSLPRLYVSRLMSSMKSLTGVVVGRAVEDLRWRYCINDYVPPGDGEESFYDLLPGDYSATLISRATLSTVGFFDPTFKPRYIEDNDFTTRVRLAGRKCVRVPVPFWHYLGATIKGVGEGDASRKPYWAANKKYYKEKWGSDCHDRSQMVPVFAEAFNGERPDPGVEAMKEAMNNE